MAAGFAEAPAAYHAAWSRFDNATGETQPIARDAERDDVDAAACRRCRAATGSFVEIDISAESAAHPSWQQPVRTFFRRTADGWKLVGLERLPDGSCAAAARAPCSDRRDDSAGDAGAGAPAGRTRAGSSACSRRSPTSAAARRRARC